MEVGVCTGRLPASAVNPRRAGVVKDRAVPAQARSATVNVTSCILDIQSVGCLPWYLMLKLSSGLVDGMVILPEPDAGGGVGGCTLESCTSTRCPAVEVLATCTGGLLPLSCLGVAPAEQHAAGQSKVIQRHGSRFIEKRNNQCRPRYSTHWIVLYSFRTKPYLRG
jgi:hypothetical protein